MVYVGCRGYDLDKIVSKVSDLIQLEPSELWAAGKEPKRVEARSLLCYWAVRDLGISMAELSRRLKLSFLSSLGRETGKLKGVPKFIPFLIYGCSPLLP